MDEVVIYAKLEYITMDADGNIVLALSKKTYRKQIIIALKEYESSEVYICIRRGKWDTSFKQNSYYSFSPLNYKRRKRSDE